MSITVTKTLDEILIRMNGQVFVGASARYVVTIRDAGVLVSQKYENPSPATLAELSTILSTGTSEFVFALEEARLECKAAKDREAAALSKVSELMTQLEALKKA